MAELKIGLVGTGAIGRTHIDRINTALSRAKISVFGGAWQF